MEKYYPRIVKPAVICQLKQATIEKTISTEASNADSVSFDDSYVSESTVETINTSTTTDISSPLQLAIEEAYDGFIDLWQVKSVTGKRDDWIKWGLALAEHDKLKILSLDDRYMDDVDVHRTQLDQLSHMGDYGGTKRYIYFCGTLVMDAF